MFIVQYENILCVSLRTRRSGRSCGTVIAGDSAEIKRILVIVANNQMINDDVEQFMDYNVIYLI